jgi:hypothetical protein
MPLSTSYLGRCLRHVRLFATNTIGIALRPSIQRRNSRSAAYFTPNMLNIYARSVGRLTHPHLDGCFVLASGTLKPSPSATNLYQLSATRLPYGLQDSLCTLHLPCSPARSPGSAAGATQHRYAMVLHTDQKTSARSPGRQSGKRTEQTAIHSRGDFTRVTPRFRAVHTRAGGGCERYAECNPWTIAQHPQR